MPFRLIDAPAIFEAMVNDMENDSHFFQKYERTHPACPSSPTAAFGELLIEKCEFHAASVSFLEFIVAKGQVRMDPAKIQAVLDWPYPMAKRSYRDS